MKTKLYAVIALLSLSGWLLSACNSVNTSNNTNNTSTANSANPARPSIAKIGSLAPEVDLKSMTGDQIVLSKLQGRPVLVNFWATWCGPCREEFPALVRKYKQYQDQGFVVLGINTQDENSDTGVLNFMK
ncbi:MAG TPA: TlpA disulfide reductase family protein, partial [Anaerolineae bacterium]